MEIQLTERAAAEYGRLSSGAMTPKMASEYLRAGNIVLRSFSETLREYYPHPDLGRRLTAAMQAYEPESAPDSVARKVRGWLEGKSRPAKREDVFRIAFALDLGEGQLSSLLGQCTGYGIHYRELRDAVYAWFLRADRGYGEARDFLASLPEPPREREYIDRGSGVHITRELQNEFRAAGTPEELREVCLGSLERFGALHLRAYQYFEKYLSQLTHPDTGWEGEPGEDYSLETVMEQYLSLHMPTGRGRGGYSVTQKLLKRNWPNATSLKNIRAHREDVPRKLLLLLYVITENVVDGEYSELDEDYLSIAERLENHWWILNAILIDCGMPTLDPRSATDWLVIYALAADGDESMSERMEQVIDHLFAGEAGG